ncbi:MAG: hypothetical protein IT210_17810 [Armatimonadetes bacterium]|nr:hypothetical protein [Armatimonadota bacterium]
MRYYQNCEREEEGAWLGLTWATILLLSVLAWWGLWAFGSWLARVVL